MDLLGVYDSNSDGDEEVKESISSNNPPSIRENVDPSNSQELATIACSQNRTATKGMTVAAEEPQSKSISNSKAKKRGKKLLKLSAILPEYIWNQLTTSTNDARYEDDSDDDDDGFTPNATKQKGAKHANSTIHLENSVTGSSTIRDAGLESLLRELPNSKSATSIAKHSSIVNENNEDITKEPEVEDVSKAYPPKKESLGFAFVTSTVVTTKRKRGTEGEVHNVHDETTRATSMPPASSPPHIESTSSHAAVTSSFPMPSRHGIQSSSAALWNLQHRPAAPVHPKRAAHVTASEPYPPPYQPLITSIHASHQNTTTATNYNPGGGKKKISRKRQMEQMLRAGQIDQVKGDHELEGTAHMYQPTELGLSGASYQGHGVRVVPTNTYNVSTGTTNASTEVTGRQRNKHQLNSLLASAASLEAKRMQNPHLSGGSGRSSHRATAKRKYGW